MKKLIALLLIGFLTVQVQAQNTDEDAFYIKDIYNTALTQGQCYNWLDYLTNNIGGRLSGSPESLAAVEYVKQMLDTLGMDTVWLQPCTVPHWVRGEKEIVRIVNSSSRGSVDLPALALGNSVGTGYSGITAEVVEIKGLDALEKMKKNALKGKIAFFSEPMDPTQISTFAAYGGAVGQRVYGASRASKLGAVGVVVRSMTTKLDDIPHTGVTVYEEGVEKKIPTFAISTKAAVLLGDMLKTEKVRIYMRSTCKMLEPKISYNVVGEIRGSEKPDEIILVGGHLDSWDVGTGAHDDGAGCVQSMDVVQLFKRLNYKPKRTLRCVLFMNEENGQAGAKAYRDFSMENKEYHLAAIESDRGGFTPRGFTCDGDETIFKTKFKKVTRWLPLLKPYNIDFKKGGSGADISRLKPQKGLLFGFWPDSQRYFDFHHAPNDLLENVNKRELELGTAAMTSLVYLLDKYGLE